MIPLQAGAVALLVLGSWLILRACIYGLEYESRPRVRRMAWRRSGIGPSEMRRLAELQRGRE